MTMEPDLRGDEEGEEERRLTLFVHHVFAERDVEDDDDD